MTKGAHHILFVGDEHWGWGSMHGGSPVVHAVDVPEEAELEQCIEAVATVAIANEYCGTGIILGLPASWCLSAGILMDGLRNSTRHDALAYQLEEKLPIAAEESTSAFLAHGSEVLGIGIAKAKVQRIVELLGQHDIVVTCVVPVTLLIAQHAVDRQCSLVAVRYGENPEAEFVWLHESKPVAWRISSLEPAAIEREIRARRLQDGQVDAAMHCLALNMPAKATDVISETGTVASSNDSPEHVAICAAGDVLAARVEPWFDLSGSGVARAQRVRGAGSFALATVGVLLVATAMSFLLRAHRYEQATSRDVAAQSTLYRELFPGVQVPIDVHSRLVAERRRLLAVAGGTQSHVVPAVDASKVLYSALRSLPTDLRYQLLDVRVERGTLYIEGEARSHGDADTIAAALRRAAGLAVQSPRSEQRSSGGVAFFIVAEAPSKALAVTDGVQR